MSKIITYKRDNTGKFCQIKLDDGNRILISVAQPGIRVYKLKWMGAIPSETIFDISTDTLFSDQHRHSRQKLTEVSLEPDMLDVLKDVLLPCKSLGEVKSTLLKIFG